MIPKTRPISLISSALKEFQTFPDAAEGGKAEIAKPMLGMGSGVFEIALPFRGNAYRVVYAVQLAHALWVVHAFQKKSTQGIKTPARELELVRERLKRLKETLS